MAASQSNVIRVEQLSALGFTESTIRRYVARGLLHPVFRGVYSWGTPHLTDNALVKGALWSCGPTAFVSGATAEAVYGRTKVDRHRIEITVPKTGGRTRTDDRLIVHSTRDTIDRNEVRTWNGLKVSTSRAS